MKNVHELVRTAQKLARDNSPLLLTAVGVTGTITTAILAGKASIKAYQFLEVEEKHARRDARTHDYVYETLPLKIVVKKVWKLYIPTFLTATGTISCIICANRIGTRRAAAYASALQLSEKAFVDYSSKVVEKLGENKERAVRDELAQDRVNNNPVGRTEVIVTGGGEVLCFDSYTGRYFTSSMETLKKAMNDINYIILNSFYASLNDYYDKIGLSRTKLGDEVGWNSDKLLELTFSTTMSDDERPCISVDFRTVPISHYSRVQ